jgi:hypothetical protein
VDAVVYANLADGPVGGGDQLAKLGPVAYRQPDAGQVLSHAITLGTKRAPRTESLHTEPGIEPPGLLRELLASGYSLWLWD